MLTRDESNTLQRLIAEYHEAWSDYVRDVAANDPSRYGSGALVTDKHDELKRFIKEKLS